MAKKQTPTSKKAKEDSIIPQAKLKRVLLMISLLKTRKWDVKDLASILDMSVRTLYRYIKLLESVDFPVEKDFHNKYYLIDIDNPDEKNNRFTMDELNVLQKLVKTGLGRNPLKQSLQKKLNIHSELESMPNLFIKVRNSKFVEQLSDAMKHRYQVILRKYHSANSHHVQDRLIEPFDFGNDYATVIALDTKDKKCKQFKLERIGEIIAHDKPFQYEKLHEKSEADIFGWMGNEKGSVTLQLDMKAYVALREEFPASIPCLEEVKHETNDKPAATPFPYQFHGPVKNYEGIGRFVLGLMPHIKISHPKEFKVYITEQLKKNKLL